jgi:hypothetical protein
MVLPLRYQRFFLGKISGQVEYLAHKTFIRESCY